MRKTFFAASAALFLASIATPAAAAEKWYGIQAFVSGGDKCKTSANRYDYAYDPVTKVFTVDNVNGRMTTITVPANGMVDKEFKSPSGNRLQVSGNVLTKDLYISAPQYGCKWATPPATIGQQAKN